MTQRKSTKLRSFGCAVFLSLVLPMPAVAQSAIETPGAASCAKLIEARDNRTESPVYEIYAGYLAGYLTAANLYEDDTFDLTPWQPIEVVTQQVAQFCSGNPELTLFDAIKNYAAFLRPDRLQEPSELMTLRNGSQAVFVYSEVLARIRAKLVETGAVITDPDGQFDQSFGEAIIAFQQSNGLPVNGLPDLQTLLKIFYGS